MILRIAFVALASAFVAWLSGDVAGAEAEGLIAAWRFDEIVTETIEVHEDTNEEREQGLESAANKKRPQEDEEDPDDEDEDSWIPRPAFYVTDDVSDLEDRLIGFHRLVPGVSGKALRFGGIGTYVVRQAHKVPQIDDAFSAEAWIAIDAYPVHWCSIAARADENRGALFGIDAYGRLGFRLAVGGQWKELVSKQRIGLREWVHVACVLRPNKQMLIYLNGQPAGVLEVEGEVEPAPDQDLLIGREPVKRKPLGTIRQHGTKDVHAYFDGLIDELKIYDRALEPDEIAGAYSEQRPEKSPQLPERRLPAGPSGPGPFGAFYTTLKYYDAWDAQWRVGEHADVVVRFDRNPCRFVFWRGTSYIPHWVTENGIWYNNEFNETWSEHGCHEPMSDKQCRHAHVRIIESNDARVVVHWRYALVDNWYEFAKVDPATGWGDWTDEVYTIYPDGVGVRKITLHSTTPRAPHEWHEGIIVMGPGQRPENVLEPGALTMMNMDGQKQTYSWRDGAPEAPTAPPAANIQIINTKSKFRPFVAVTSESEPEFDIYDGELRRDVSMFPWWNHWPTAFDPCDGRYAMDADRASHSSLTHCHWRPYQETENSMTKIMLHGVTENSPEHVLRLARSWDSPPKLSVAGDGFSARGYDPAQRAYMIRRHSSGNPADLRLRLLASQESPVANLAIVIQGWNAGDVTVDVDGKPTKFRVGRNDSLDGSDLILWIEHHATAPTLFRIQPKG